jgi:threonine dehydratase
MAGRLFEKVVKAAQRIRPEARRTPLEHSPILSRETGAIVYLKWENRQVTGSFKFRGALNKVRSLPLADVKRGAVTASTGNHGLGASLAARTQGLDLTLVLPAHVSAEKRRRLAESGTRLLDFGENCEEAEIYARRLARDTGRIYISPYNDIEVIAGQGTIGVEVASDFPGAQSVLVPVGGGGLVSGIAVYLRPVLGSAEILGVEPETSAFMEASLAAGRIVEIEERETVADAVAGGIEPDSITFPLCRELVHGIITVSESAIREAMSLLFETHGEMVEGAGALPLAAVLSARARFERRKIVLIVSGGNISTEAFRDAIRGSARRAEDLR